MHAGFANIHMNTRTSKKLWLSASALGLGLALTGAAAAFAQTTIAPAPKTGFFQSLVTAFAQKFNLNESDVKAFVDEQVSAHQADMEAKMKQAEADRLVQAVSNGKLTQAQADLITAKEAEIKIQIDALRGKTGQELKSDIKTIQDSLKAWVTSNNIPEQFLRPAFGKGHGKGFVMMKHW